METEREQISIYIYTEPPKKKNEHEKREGIKLYNEANEKGG